MGAPQSRLEDVKLELLLDAVAHGVPQVMIARGSSMWPALRDGDRVELSPPAFPIPLGAVVAVRRGGSFLIHRVCGVRPGGGLLVKGDNCPKPDGWFGKHEVVAVVARVERRGGLRPVLSAHAARSPSVILRTRVASLVQRLRRSGKMCASGGMGTREAEQRTKKRVYERPRLESSESFERLALYCSGLTTTERSVSKEARDPNNECMTRITAS